MTYQDNMTLDEIHDYDNEMVDEAIKGAKNYNFKNLASCIKFMGLSVDATLRYLGVRLNGSSNDSNTDKQLRALKIDRLFKKHDIRIERRRHYRKGERWRNGLYIYKKDVLVSYTSEPIEMIPNKFAIEQSKSYSIITNAKVEQYA